MNSDSLKKNSRKKDTSLIEEFFNTIGTLPNITPIYDCFRSFINYRHLR